MAFRNVMIIIVGFSFLEETLGFAQSGPYDIVIDEIGMCDNPGTLQINFGTKIHKKDKGKSVYDSNFTLGVPIDEDIKVYADYQEWGNGGYRPRSMEYTVKGCEEAWKLASDFLIDLMKSAGVELKKCPIPAGSYKADNMEVKVSLKIPVMPYKRSRLILHIFYKDVKVGCLKVSGAIVRKTFI